MLLYNYNYSVIKINYLLKKLKKYPLEQSSGFLSINEIKEITRYLAEVHKQNIVEQELRNYDGLWVVEKIKNEHPSHEIDDIIDALYTMLKIENYQLKSEQKNNFLSWNIDSSKWVKTFNEGHTGCYIWDLAAILYYISDPIFSEIFLENYIKYSNVKPSINAIYANIFYMQVMDAVKNNKYNSLRQITTLIKNECKFKTNIINENTLHKLELVGYG